MKKSFATLVSKQPLQGLRHQNELSTAGQKYSVFGEKVTDFLGKIHAKKAMVPNLPIYYRTKKVKCQYPF